ARGEQRDLEVAGRVRHCRLLALQRRRGDDDDRVGNGVLGLGVDDLTGQPSGGLRRGRRREQRGASGQDEIRPEELHSLPPESASPKPFCRPSPSGLRPLDGFEARAYRSVYVGSQAPCLLLVTLAAPLWQRSGDLFRASKEIRITDCALSRIARFRALTV